MSHIWPWTKLEAFPNWLRNLWCPFSEAWYWFRTHTYNRYHILDLRCPNYGLGYKWGWIDSDCAMLIACFNLLKDYVEKEHAFKVIDWEADDSHRQTALEIKRLYRWWTHDRLLAQQAVEHRYLDDATKYITKDEALERVDNRMLRRLIEIREYLWT